MDAPVFQKNKRQEHILSERMTTVLVDDNSQLKMSAMIETEEPIASTCDGSIFGLISQKQEEGRHQKPLVMFERRREEVRWKSRFCPLVMDLFLDKSAKNKKKGGDRCSNGCLQRSKEEERKRHRRVNCVCLQSIYFWIDWPKKEERR